MWVTTWYDNCDSCIISLISLSVERHEPCLFGCRLFKTQMLNARLMRFDRFQYIPIHFDTVPIAYLRYVVIHEELRRPAAQSHHLISRGK